ncbi:MAG: hypothetical protein UV73_C0004G0006 [Candidatus Gottesmanbacteria bacterium GW2011_GWA2_43_14]|uniref:DUF5667 domain-containing protein n=1 Tax=Candidatus Gottesmanbacteria bacterium GW2011_GWA2_43_14 TaxID=1618443 RepID=A0A0G1DJM2_9BACT|nr:MAG: hypothetical protein UV73_C0004G0006 [Candidatus Gottesmanbacteria bacterium GW2011_GWA2_43_14]
MKTILSLLLSCVVLGFFFFRPSDSAAEALPTPVDYHLPYPGMTPDHPLYTVKKIRDWLLLNFNRDPVRKVEIHLLLADKKLVMAELLINKRNTRLAVDTYYDSQVELVKAVTVMSEVNSVKEPPTGLADKLELASRKHEEMIKKQVAVVTDIKSLNQLKQALSLNEKAYSQIQLIK